jgi:ElaB/YqjD/DUF883 family membrane-anchored ribosome-binding protein
MIDPDIKTQAENVTENVKESAKEFQAQAKEYTNRTLETGEQYVRSNPLQSVLGAAAVGFLIALLLPRTSSRGDIRSFRERYIDDSLDDIRDSIDELSKRISRSSESAMESTSSGLANLRKRARSWLSFLD